MPSKLRAGGVFPFILPDDRNETDEPQFMVRVLSAQENADLYDHRLAYTAARSLKDRLQVMRDALVMTVAECLIGDDPIESQLTETECWQVINGASEGSSLSADERKKFVSPLPSAMASSAKVAEVENAATD